MAARKIAAAAWAVRAELLTAAAFLAGWTLITAAVAAVISAPGPRVVWWVSGGILCWSLGGWRLLWTLVTEGLYALSRGGRRRG